MQEKERRSAAAQAQKSADVGAEGMRGTDNTENVKTGAPNNARTAENTKNTANTVHGAELVGNTVRRSAAADRWGKSVGENGQKAYNDNIREDTDLDMYTKGFARYYDLGLSGVPFETVKQEMKGNTFGEYLTPDQSYAAYYSGVNDAKLSLENEKNRVKTVDYFSDDAGIVNNEHLAGLDKDFLKATDRLAKGLGVQVVFSDTLEGGKVNGFIENGKIMLSRDSQMSYASLAGHEITHRMQELAPEEYRAYRDFVMSKVGADAVDAYRTKLLDAGYPMTEEQILDEVAANFTGEKILKDTDSINDFVNEVKEKTGNLNIIQRLHKAICDFIAKVKNIFKGDKSAQDAAAQKAFGTDTATLERARDLLKQAYDKGVKEIESRKGEQTGEYTDLGNGVRYSVKETFDEQIDKWSAGEMRSDLDFRVCNTPNSLKKIGIEDMPIVMTQKVMKKITGGKHDLSLNEIKKIPQNLAEPIMVFKSATQNNAFVVLTEMNDMHGDAVVVALHVNKEYKHMKVNNIASVYGKKNIENFIGMQSEAGNLLYIDKNKSQQWSQSRGLRLPKLADTIIDNDSVSQKENNVNTHYTQNDKNNIQNTRKFSVKTEPQNIEETKDMLAVHNLSLEKLTKVLKLGGLPMPSIAVVKARDGHKSFGNISLVFDKNTIDPESNSNNKIYSGDAWTPTYPTVEYKPSAAKTEQLHNLYYNLAEKFGYDEVRPLYNFADESNLSDKLNRAGGEAAVIKELKENTDLMQLFFQAEGDKKIEPIEKQTVTTVSDAQKGQYDYLIKAVGKEFFEKMKAPPGTSPFSFAKTYFKENGEDFKKAYSKMFSDLYGWNSTEIKNILNNMTDAGYVKLIRECGNYIKNGGTTVKAEVDSEATRKEIIKKAEKMGFDKWVDKTFGGMVEKKGIYNNKDPYTPSGNRKSFEQLHYEYTVENIVRAMKEAGEKGLGGFGGGNIFGASTTTFDTISDVKKDAKKRMKNMSEEQYETIKQEFIDRMYELSKSAVIHKDNFNSVEAAADVFAEAASKYSKRADIARYLKSEFAGWANYSDKITDNFMQLVDDIRQMPVNYFEAKPQRVVGFDEVKAVIVPNEVRGNEGFLAVEKVLNENSIPVVEYDSSKEGARTQALNSVDNVRFSVKGTENIVENSEKLKEYELALAQKYEDLKKQGTKNISKAEFVKAAKNILEELDLAYNKKEFAADLEGLAEDTQAIIKGEMDFDTFRGKVRSMAENIIDSGTVHDTEAYADTKELREYLRTTPIKVDSETRANLGDEYESIRKNNFGRLRLNQSNGIDIGTAYREMSILFPEFFDAEKETNGSAQLRNIADVIEHIKSLNDNPYNGYRNEAAEWLSNMIIDSIYDVGFKTGKYSTRIVADTLKLRENAEQAFKSAAESDRKWRNREYDKLRREFERKDKRRTERREKLIKMKQIRLHTERISKMLLNPSERVAVPEFIKKPVAEVLSCIDLRNDRMGEKTIQRLMELGETYRMIAEGETDESLVIDPDLEYSIKTIASAVGELNTKDKRLSELPNETLETLRQAVTAIETSVSTYNKTFRSEKAERIEDLASGVISDMKKRKDFRESKLGAVQAGSDLLHMDMLNPWDFFHMLGPTAESLYGEIREGMNRQTNNINRAVRRLQELKKDCGINEKAVTGKQAKVTEYTLSNGQKVSLTKAQVMSLYCLSRQKASHEHMTMGGIKPGRIEQSIITDKDGKKRVSTKIDSKEKRVRVTLEDVGNIVGTLSDKEKAFAEGISKYFSTVCAAQGNEVSLQLYGYKKFNATNYFPIKSDDRFIEKEYGVSLDGTLKNMGITKKRVRHANNPIIIEDIFDVYARHTSDMANYNAYVLPLQDLQRVFNAKGLEDGVSVREVLEEKFGRRASNYFANLMTDINGGAKYEGGNRLINKSVSNYKAAKIGANLRVVIQQPMSYIRAGILIDPKYMIKASGRKVDLETVYKYSPIARWKDWGFFSLDTGRDMKSLILDRKQFADYTMAFAGKADQVTWKRIWNAVELEVADKNPGLTKGSQAFYTECGKRFDEIIDRTQVVDSTLHRSQTLRSKDGLVKLSASFMSEPIKTYNLIHTAAEDYKANPNKQTRARLARTGAVCIISSLALAAVTGAYDTLKGDDDDEGFYESIYNRLTGKEVAPYENGKQSLKRRFISNAVDNFVGDWTGMIPIVKDVFSIIQGFTPKRMEMQGISDLVASIRRAGSDNYTTAFKIADLARYGADFLGIPVTSLKTAVYDILVKNVFKAVDDQWFDYNITKQVYLVENSRNKGKFTDILFDAWRKGHKEQYDAIVADMIDNGIDAKVINARLKAKYKEFMETDEFKESKGFDVPWDNRAEIPSKERESQPGLESLNSRQYASYERYATRLENDLKGKISSYRDEFSTDDYNSILSAAYDYATETALEKASGGSYDSEKQWINDAQAAEEMGLDPAEYIKYKQEYGARALAIDKLEGILMSGIDVEKYLEFNRFASEAKADRDANGKSISGSKKRKVVDYLNDSGVTDDEWDYFYYDVMGYKK